MFSKDFDRPRVSVAMPAYNAAETILAAVNSVFAQTMSDVELIVCDDASVDGTLDILKEIDDPRLVILCNSVNQGEGRSRDLAIAAARGEWLAVLDADDVWHERRLEDLLEATCDNHDVMVFDDLLICHHTPKGLTPWRPMRGDKAFGGDGVNSIDVPVSAWAASSQFLIKPIIHAETLRRTGVNHSSLKFGADTEFFLRLIASGVRMRYLPRAYYWYRITPNSASANSRRAELMNRMLTDLLPLFSNDLAMRDAIRSRIKYREFLYFLKRGKVFAAIKIVFESPRILPEFWSRSFRQALYLLHRKIHDGSSR